MSDALKPVVDGNCELIRPVASSVAKQQVPALLGRPLLLRPQAKIVELLCRGVETKAESKTRGSHQALVAAGSRIALSTDFRSRTRAGVDQAPAAQGLQVSVVKLASLALANEETVGRKPEPLEIFENGALELRSAAGTVVVFDAQQHAAVMLARKAPHLQRVEHVADVQISRRRRRKPCDHLATMLRLFEPSSWPSRVTRTRTFQVPAIESWPVPR